MSDYPTVPGPDPASHPALAELIETLRRQHRDAVSAVLLYGSCLRSGDIFDGLLDLYLVCDDYRSAYRGRRLAFMNYLLPPNVFYVEQAQGEQTLRCKVTVISRRDFRHGCSRNWFQSYIWGRFSQPTRIVYARDPGARAEAEECLLEAVYTLLHRALPMLPPEGTLSALWEQALALSYATELRTERPGRAGELASSAADFYGQVTRYHADSHAFPFAVYDENGQLCYRCQVGANARRSAAAAWWLRRVQGKIFSVLRLVKALFTFEGGLDYIAWKLERHSGEKIVIPENVRRAPLIYMWGFFWGLYRRGIFK